MPLDVNRIKGKISTLMSEMLTREETSIEEFSQRIAEAIVEEIKEAKVVYVSGLSAPNGPVIGEFNGNLQ